MASPFFNCFEFSKLLQYLDNCWAYSDVQRFCSHTVCWSRSSNLAFSTKNKWINKNWQLAHRCKGCSWKAPEERWSHRRLWSASKDSCLIKVVYFQFGGSSLYDYSSERRPLRGISWQLPKLLKFYHQQRSCHVAYIVLELSINDQHDTFLAWWAKQLQ
eukprot:3327197-Amphidinium_carterae.1